MEHGNWSRSRMVRDGCERQGSWVFCPYCGKSLPPRPVNERKPPRPSGRLRERARVIKRAHEKGLSFGAIGRVWGITAARVFQIVAKERRLEARKN